MGQCQNPHKGFCAMYRSAPTPTQRVMCHVQVNPTPKGFCAMYRSMPTPTQRVLCHVRVSTNTHTKVLCHVQVSTNTDTQGFVPCTGQHQYPHKGFCAMYRSVPTPTQIYRSVPTPTHRVLCHVQVSTNTHTKGSVPRTGQSQHPHKGFVPSSNPHLPKLQVTGQYVSWLLLWHCS